VTRGTEQLVDVIPHMCESELGKCGRLARSLRLATFESP
jgi:hypothetical protein